MSPAAQRSILHVDMDAFFVSAELVRRPELRGKAVVVGGDGPRGVVAAASYEARRFGVHSAMASATARRLCPHLVFLRGDHGYYSEISHQVFERFRGVTPLVEGLSLDEAFLDVTGSIRLLGEPLRIAERLRDVIRTDLDLVCSVGIAPNKFLAKLASEAAKPRVTNGSLSAGHGVFEVRAGHELEFLHPLPVGAMWGVGPATRAKLERIGVRTVGDVAQLDEQMLCATLGVAAGRHLFGLAWANDERPVEPDRAVKSISHEETFASDRYTVDELRRELTRLADGVTSRLRAAKLLARTFTIKVRFNDFSSITRSVTVAEGLDTSHAVVAVLRPLLHSFDPTPGVRLLGVAASNFGTGAQQLTLALSAESDDASEATEVEWRRAEAALDKIRSRFGATAIGPASAVEGDRLRVVRQGGQQWGPTSVE